VGSTGYVKRSVDLSKEVSAHLRFWAKAYSISSGYEANCLVSDDGIEWAPPVATWNSSNDDNVYHYYDIDLTPYNLSGEFWIAFDANLRNTGDYLYVDKIEIVWPVASYVTIAWDDFESGAVWTGGGGWLDNWTHSGDSLVTTSGTPYEGSYHLRLRSSTGYVRRSVNLSSEASSHLQFWAKAESITRGYEANCLVSDDGIGWDTVATWNSSNDNNGYEYYDIDLTPYNLSSQFWIAFDANLYNVYDLLYVDNIVITGIHGYGITSRAGDRRVKAVVDLGGGSVTVLAWYIK
jgi:hypothetical protein